jgi:hypothetical protein
MKKLLTVVDFGMEEQIAIHTELSFEGHIHYRQIVSYVVVHQKYDWVPIPS